jgi:hypothetical protein
MKKFILLICLLSLFCIVPFGDATVQLPVVEFTEEDGSPSIYPYQVKFPNNSLTDNVDGTVSVDWTDFSFGNISADGFCSRGNISTVYDAFIGRNAYITGDLAVDGDATFGGDIGIGTTAPDRKLEINTGAATDGIRISYNDSDGSAVTYSDILVDSNGDLTLDPTGLDALIDGGLTVGSTTQAGDNNLRVEGTSDLVGNVGIGTAAVTTDTLKISGDYNQTSRGINLVHNVTSTIGATSFGMIVDVNDDGAADYGGIYGIYLTLDATNTNAKSYRSTTGISARTKDYSTYPSTYHDVSGIRGIATSSHSSVPCYGVYAQADGLGTNYAVSAKAINGTSNYSFYGVAGTLHNVGDITTNGDLAVDGDATFGGDIGIGTTAPGAKLEVNGLIAVSVDADTIADDGVAASLPSYTLTPTTSFVKLTCDDPDGANITMGETGIAEGATVTIVNVSANVCNFADTAGVSELAGAFAMGQYQSLKLVYIGDRWVEISRSAN